MSPLRFAWREIRHRPTHAALFIAAVSAGSAAVAGLSVAAAAVGRSAQEQARALVAADVSVQGPADLLEELRPWAEARWPGAAAARAMRTFSMTRSGPDGPAAQAALTAVTPGYPLHGEVRTESGANLTEVLGPGRAVVARKLLELLGVDVGGALWVGDRRVTIADVVAARTESPGAFWEVAPTVFVTPEDLDASGLLAPGARRWDTLYLRMPIGTDVASAAAGLRERVGDRAEVSSWATEQPGLLSFLRRTLTFLYWMGLLVQALAAAAAAGTLGSALTAARPGFRAVLALGAPRSFVVRVGIWWAVLLTAAGVVVAAVAALPLAGLWTGLLRDILPRGLSVAFPARELAGSAALCFGVGLAFAAFPLRRLASLAPAGRVGPEGPGRAPFLAGLLRSKGPAVGGTIWRLALRGLARPGQSTGAALAALAAPLTLIFSIHWTRQGLLEGLIRAAPDGAPNVYFANVGRGQGEILQEIVGVPLRLHPLVRGRVLSVDGRPARDVDGSARRRDGSGDRLTREFGFTFGDDLLPTDRVVDGPGLWDPSVEGPQVSVFDEFRDRFGIRPGSRIEVSILGRRIAATVSSLRAIDRSARRPFFYFQFQPGALNAAPYTLMGGARVAKENIPALEIRLAREMPHVTVVDLADVAALAEKILGRLVRAVSVLGGLALAAGAALLIAVLWAALALRARETAIHRALGAGPGHTTAAAAGEFLLLGGAASLAALGISLVLARVLLSVAFDVSFAPGWGPAMALPIFSTAGVCLLAMASVLPAFRVRPWDVLRYE